MAPLCRRYVHVYTDTRTHTQILSLMHCQPCNNLRVLKNKRRLNASLSTIDSLVFIVLHASNIAHKSEKKTINKRWLVGCYTVTHYCIISEHLKSLSRKNTVRTVICFSIAHIFSFSLSASQIYQIN